MNLLRPVLGVVLWLYLLSSAHAAPRGPVVIILLPGTTLTDWQSADAPTLHRLLATGAVAVMNTRTARLPTDRVRETPESAALTLGAGSRAAGGPDVTAFHTGQETVAGGSCTYAQLFMRRTGAQAGPRAWVNVDWARVQRANQAKGYDLRPGNLGDALHLHGVAIVAGGGRFAFPVACDSDGVISRVIASDRLPHPLPPCLLWDAGADVRSADTVLSAISVEVREAGGTLVVISPFVGDRPYAAGRRLAPVVVWGPEVPPGFLYSPSTHRAGLVTNTDFAPTITALLGADTRRPWLPVPAFGHPWEVRPAQHAAAAAARLERAAYSQSRALRRLPAIAALLGILVLSGLLFSRVTAVQCVTWLPILIIFSLVVSSSLIVAAIWACGLGILLWKIPGLTPSRSAALLASLTVAVLVGDMLLGDPLMRWGLLGYSAVEGARYYGIGNEAMGPLIGAALVLAASIWPRQRAAQAVSTLVLLGIAALLGLPSAGAKAGGLLVAVAGFAVFLWTIWGRRWSASVVAFILGLMVLALAGVSLGDLGYHAGQQSHIGQGIERIRTRGLTEAGDIISRKLAVEGRLAYHSVWAIPLWVSVGGLTLAGRRTRNRRESALLYGGATSVICCLAVNDAGVVAGALCGSIVVCGLSALSHQAKQKAVPAER